MAKNLEMSDRVFCMSHCGVLLERKPEHVRIEKYKSSFLRYAHNSGLCSSALWIEINYQSKTGQGAMTANTERQVAQKETL